MADPEITIGLDLLGLPTLRQGGAGLLAGMEAEELSRRPSVRLHVAAGPGVAEELRGERLSTHPATAGSRSGRQLARARELASPLQAMADVAPVGAFAGCEVVHYPLSFMTAPAHEGATVVTCVDLQHLHYPRFFSKRDRALRALRWHRSVRRATRVAVFSEFVKGSVAERLGVPAERIDVVGACCSQRFFAVRPTAELGPPFVFYPASPLPAKNHARLLRAFSSLDGAHAEVRLVLVGPATHDWSPVRRQIVALGLEDRVEIRGHVSLDELIEMYSRARAMVFPSLFEGFGMPVLEAMAAGCPVVASNTTSVPEVCGDAALLVDPAAVDSIAAGLERVLELRQADRAGLVAAARERARGFSLEAMVDRQLRAFRCAVDTVRR